MAAFCSNACNDRFMCVVVREDQGFGFACTASPVRSGKKKHTVPAITIATITATTIFTAGSTESGRPQLGLRFNRGFKRANDLDCRRTSGRWKTFHRPRR
jgi:hypothetical protein